MPVRSSRAMIPLDILDKIADDPKGFKAALRKFEDAQEASRKEAGSAGEMQRAAEQHMAQFRDDLQAFEAEKSAVEKDCEKRTRALERLERRSAGRSIDLDQRERNLADWAEKQHAREAGLNERETGLDTRETALNAREIDLNTREAGLNVRETDLTAGETKLRGDVRDLNDRLSGFRMSA